jgi:hypothetical protein
MSMFPHDDIKLDKALDFAVHFRDIYLASSSVRLT